MLTYLLATLAVGGVGLAVYFLSKRREKKKQEEEQQRNEQQRREEEKRRQEATERQEEAERQRKVQEQEKQQQVHAAIQRLASSVVFTRRRVVVGKRQVGNQVIGQRLRESPYPADEIDVRPLNGIDPDFGNT